MGNCLDIVCEGVKVTKTGRRQNRLVLDEIADGHRRATIIDIARTNRPDQPYGTVHLPLPAHAAGPMARHGTVDWSIATQLTKINLSARWIDRPRKDRDRVADLRRDNCQSGVAKSIAGADRPK